MGILISDAERDMKIELLQVMLLFYYSWIHVQHQFDYSTMILILLYKANTFGQEVYITSFSVW